MRITMKAARVNSGLSLDDIAKSMGVSKSTVNRWENGILPVPQERFVEFCGLCGINTRNVKAVIEIKGDKRKEESRVNG